jgi:tetratricopeptide (TPR) repeat protein
MTQLFPPPPSHTIPSTAPPPNGPSNHSLGLQDSLGAALTHQGKYAEAVTLLQETLAQRESLGQSSVSADTLRTKNNLAAALHHFGQRTEAEALYREVLAAEEGNGHPDSAVTMGNLAALLGQDNSPAKRQEAVELIERARGIRLGGGVEEEEGQEEGEQGRGFRGEEGQRAMQEGRWEEAERIFREGLAVGVV